MSRNYRGGYRARRERQDHLEDSGSNSEQKHNRDGDQRQRHPPGLRGRAIGMFYANLAHKKNGGKGDKRQKSRSLIKEHPYFSLDFSKEQIIEEFLTSDPTDKTDQPCELDKNVHKNSFEEKYLHIKDSEFKREFLNIISGSIQESLSKAMCMNSKLIRNNSLDNQLQEELQAKMKQDKYKAMINARRKLPAFNMRNEILKIVGENQVVVISGETGCGKTTQVAQFILDDAIKNNNGSTTKIVCTQPRRISAISVAERVAAERAEKLGKSVGYQIRAEKTLCRDHGSILFCTTGVVLQFMKSDPALRDYSHIILDEIHERNTVSDFIITLLKQVIPKRPDLKVILMSATLNADRFSQYYDDSPTIHIPGFTYPVTEYYLEDVIKMTRFHFEPERKMRLKEEAEFFKNNIEWELKKLLKDGSYPAYVSSELLNPASEFINLKLIQSLLEHICTTKGPGAILVFLPGYQDIKYLNVALTRSGKFPSSKFRIYPLHSILPTAEQKLVFDVPPVGVRKIIISTSIAETSITIEDVVYVVDCGRTKLSRFDANRNLETLNPEWITLANGKQRRGRAGRVQPGECYHLYTRVRERLLAEYPTPEMLRTPLEEVILQLKILQLGRVDVFLGSVLDPPDDKAIDLSLKLLRDLDAIDDKENLTPLGYHLAQMPLHPRTGKMCLWASIFSCVEPVFSIAATLSFKDAFYCPMGKEMAADKAKMSLGLGQFSDHIAFAQALRGYEKRLPSRRHQQFCYDHFLSCSTLKLLGEMKQQFAQDLFELKFLDSRNPREERANKNSHNWDLVKAIVCAGLFPNIAVVSKAIPKFVILKTPEDGSVKIHPGSVNARVKQLPTSYVTYFVKQQSSCIFLHDTTCVNEAALIFAAAKCSIKQREKRALITVTSDISFLTKQRTGQLIEKLQEKLNKLLEHKFSHPGTIRWESQEASVLKAVIALVSEGDTIQQTEDSADNYEIHYSDYDEEFEDC